MKILCVGYRKWSKEIYKNIAKKKDLKIYFHSKKSGLNKKILRLVPDMIFFYGWSWIIKKKFLINLIALCYTHHHYPSTEEVVQYKIK